MRLMGPAGISAFEAPFFTWLAACVGTAPLLELFMKWLLDAHLVKLVPLVLVIVGFWFALRPDRTHVRQRLVEAVLGALAALVIARLLALLLPFRERPLANPDLHFTVTIDAAMRTWSSFPSDHAVVAFALAAALMRVSRRVGIWALVHVALFVCAPRLFFGLHYPSDVIGGALIGVAIVGLVAHAPRREAVTTGVLALEARWPALFYPAAFFVLFEIAEMFNSVRVLVINLFRVLHTLIR